MKKISMVIIAVMFLVILNSCGSKNENIKNEVKSEDCKMLLNIFYDTDNENKCEENLIKDISLQYMVIYSEHSSYAAEIEDFKQKYDVDDKVVIPNDIEEVYICTVIIDQIKDEMTANELVDYISNIDGVRKIDYTYPYKEK